MRLACTFGRSSIRKLARPSKMIFLPIIKIVKINDNKFRDWKTLCSSQPSIPSNPSHRYLIIPCRRQRDALPEEEEEASSPPDLANGLLVCRDHQIWQINTAREKRHHHQEEDHHTGTGRTKPAVLFELTTILHIIDQRKKKEKKKKRKGLVETISVCINAPSSL